MLDFFVISYIIIIVVSPLDLAWQECQAKLEGACYARVDACRGAGGCDRREDYCEGSRSYGG